MIVVEPSSLRYESSEGGGASDEHLLERVSVLENRLGRLADRMERALDLLLRQAQNSYLDRALLKSLIALLAEDGVVENEALERAWQQRCEQDAATQEQSSRRDQLRAKIAASYSGADRRSFEQLVNEGFSLLETQNPAGIESLRRAVEKDPQNGPLLSFVGEQFFRTSKMKLARQYLTKAVAFAPEDNHLLLLLGLACADEGETERAKELLATTMQRGGPSFAAHFGLGRLFVAEQQWQKALREFKRALASKPSPEAHYALGCLYYQLGRDGLATRHLLKAVDLDPNYAESFHLLGLVYERTGNSKSASDAFEKVTAIRSSSARSGGKAGSRSDRVRASFFLAGNGKRKHLVTGGDPRLARALREDALKAFNT
jgi:tetratricopeptide (TPR) repeat protein